MMPELESNAERIGPEQVNQAPFSADGPKPPFTVLHSDPHVTRVPTGSRSRLTTPGTEGSFEGGGRHDRERETGPGRSESARSVARKPVGKVLRGPNWAWALLRPPYERAHCHTIMPTRTSPFSGRFASVPLVVPPPRVGRAARYERQTLLSTSSSPRVLFLPRPCPSHGPRPFMWSI
jgi:hypothetical protein